MNHDEIKEFHSLIDKHIKDNGYTTSVVLAFLTSTYVGTMAMNGFSLAFFDATAARMREKFIKMKQEMESKHE